MLSMFLGHWRLSATKAFHARRDGSRPQRHVWHLALACTAMALAIAGCSGEDQAVVGIQDVSTGLGDTAKGDVSVDSTGVDSVTQDTAGGDTSVDAADTVDPGDASDVGSDTTGTDGSATCPGGVGCACEDNAQCGNGFCVVTAAGKFCAPACGSTCPDGHCVKLPGTEVSACVDPIGPQCFPCKASA